MMLAAKGVFEEGSKPEMRMWSMSLVIQSDIKMVCRSS